MASSCARQLFGIEIEFGFAAFDDAGERIPASTALRMLLEECRNRWTFLPCNRNSRLYLANGSLLYPDVGHPEFATAECSTPAGLLKALRAGERLMAEAARFLEQREGIGAVVLFCTNVDYSIADATWGCHESYLSRREPRKLAKQVVPHLVSRIVFSGAGGFDPRAPSARFALSPRAFHLNRSVSCDGDGVRAVFSLRQEPLGANHHRVHLVCGEPNCAELATYLKVGTTALVLAMADQQIELDLDPRYAARAVRAIQRCAVDPTCTEPLFGGANERGTALEIQRVYLEQAERHAGAPFMPTWAEEVCAQWRRVLDAIEIEPMSLVGTLDWPTKLALFQDHARRTLGLDWSSLTLWSGVVEGLTRRLPREEEPFRWDARRVRYWLAQKGTRARILNSIGRTLARHGLDWDGLDAFNTLRDELCEIDVRYGQLYPPGIRIQLESAGLADGRLVAADEVDAAVERAPEPGRARLRGDWIRRLSASGSRDRYTCDWTGIFGRERMLDLSDPFVTQAAWADVGAAFRRNRAIGEPAAAGERTPEGVV